MHICREHGVALSSRQRGQDRRHKAAESFFSKEAKKQKTRFLKGFAHPRPRLGRELVRPEGFEPPTNGFGSHYSIRLSYGRNGRAF